MFWCVLFYLGALRTVWVRYETRWKTGRNSAKVRARSRVGIFRNECTRSNPLDPKLMFWCVLFYLGASRAFSCVTKLGAKQAELGQKFVPRSRVRTFRNERTPSTPLNHKLMFWCVSYYLGAFGSVWLPYKKLGAKRVELVLKLVPQSHVGIFCNECS